MKYFFEKIAKKLKKCKKKIGNEDKITTKKSQARHLLFIKIIKINKKIEKL